MSHSFPKFDAKLDDILARLEPHERICAQENSSPHCLKKFSVTDDDIRFYRKLRVPPPKLCPPCRRMRRFAFSPMLRFYKTECVAPSHTEKVISIVPPKSAFKVYDWDYYHTYAWDPLSYGIFPETSHNLFDELWGLRLRVPQPAIVRDPSNIDSDYTVNGRNLKRGYFVSGGWNSENVYYSATVSQNSRDVMDSYQVQNATECYEGVFSKNLNNTDFLYFSNDCYSCRFMYDSKNCHDCFGGVNLRNRSYCFFNEQLTKEAYEKKIAEVKLGNRAELLRLQKRFWDLVKSQPARALRNEQALRSIGNHIIESKNCYEAYVAEKCENIRFADMTIGNHDSMDYSASGGSELLYETVGVGSQCSNVKFSFGSKFITDSEFVINCRSVSNCFGCIGLENQSYCIFNRKYEPEEYERIVDSIKTKMLEEGNYGEFFPFKFSAYAYNDSFASLVFPLSDSEEKKFQVNPPSEIDDNESYENAKIQKNNSYDDIEAVGDEILKEAFLCEATKRPFRIIPEELAFYRGKELPIPTIHPNERIRRRYILANPYRLYDGVCDRCGMNIKTMYEPKSGFRSYCEQCYQTEVV